MPEQRKVEEKALTTADVATEQPLIHGDWVLFHPVYSDGELKAVKVRHVVSAMHRVG